MKLTPANARNMQPGDTLKCDKVPGLSLRCQAKAKSWSLYYRAGDGSQRRPTIGGYPALNIDSARAAARVLLQQVAAGADPSAIRRASRAAPTINDLCDLYEKEWLPKKAESSAKEDRRQIRQFVRPQWGKRKLASITKSDAEKLLDKIYTQKLTRQNKFYRNEIRPTAPFAHNNARSLLKKMFNFAIDHEGEIAPLNFRNPFNATKKKTTRSRRRKASGDELQAIGLIVQSVRSTRPGHVAALLTLFTSGGRVTEIVKAKRTELSGNVLRKDNHKTEEHVADREIIIPQIVMHLITQLPKHRTYLFGDICMKRFWNAVRKGAGCPDLQLRDARRTFASIAKNRGVSLDQVGELFGHTSTQTTDGYAWLYDDRKQEVVKDVGGVVADLMQISGPIIEPEDDKS